MFQVVLLQKSDLYNPYIIDISNDSYYNSDIWVIFVKSLFKQ